MQSTVTNPHLEGYNIIVLFWKKYWNPSKGTFTCPPPKCSGTYGDENKFNVWSVAVAAQAIIDGARIYPEELGPLIDPVINALLRYRSSRFYGYCAVEDFNGNDDIYYDDDAQVASALITAYEITSNKRYLNEARSLVRYLMGGWNNDNNAKIKGGILWHRNKPYISAISNSEVAYSLLQIARHIPNERAYYVNFAIRIIDWLIENLRDPEDDIIIDGVDKNSGDKNGMKWTYNTGVTLSCCCLLYQFTNDEKWLKLSNDFAAASTNREKSLFCRDYNEFGRRYWRDPSYFVQLLIEGLSNYMLMIGDKIPESTSNAIKLEFKRHLGFFRKYNYDHKDGLYYQMFEAHRISKEIWEVYREQFGDSKQFDPNPEERAQEGNQNINEKPLVKTLIGSASAARIWFQAGRVVPQL